MHICRKRVLRLKAICSLTLLSFVHSAQYSAHQLVFVQRSENVLQTNDTRIVAGWLQRVEPRKSSNFPSQTSIPRNCGSSLDRSWVRPPSRHEVAR